MDSLSKDQMVEEEIDKIIDILTSTDSEDYKNKIESEINKIYNYRDNLKNLPEKVKRRLSYVLISVLRILSYPEEKDSIISELKRHKESRIFPEEWDESFVYSDLREMVETVRKNAVKD